jgi:hypothetical protein
LLLDKFEAYLFKILQFNHNLLTGPISQWALLKKSGTCHEFGKVWQPRVIIDMQKSYFYEKSKSVIKFLREKECSLKTEKFLFKK